MRASRFGGLFLISYTSFEVQQSHYPYLCGLMTTQGKSMGSWLSKYGQSCVLAGIFILASLPAGYSQQNPFDIVKRETKKEIPPVDSQSVVVDSILEVVEQEEEVIIASPAAPESLLLSEESEESNPFESSSDAVEDPDMNEDVASPELVDKESLISELPIPEQGPGPIEYEAPKKPASNGLPAGGAILKKLESIEIQEVSNRSLLVGTSILSLFLLASLLAINRSLVRKSYRAIANDNYLRFLFREYKSMPWLYWLFYLHFFINAGFFLYLLIEHFHWYHKSSLLVLLTCVFLVAFSYLLKHLTLLTLSSTFPVEKETSLYGFVTLLVNILLGLALTPINLLIAFGPAPMVGAMIWVGISTVVLLYLFRQLKGLFISGRLLQSYLFHFFLYLCTAEIAPLLIVGKLALGNFEVH